MQRREPLGDITTLQSHVLERKLEHSEDDVHTLSWIVSALSISAKVISAAVRQARLIDVLGDMGSTNVQGETQQKLDVIANEILLRSLGRREGVAIVASEENEEAVLIRDERQGPRRYCVLFDPLDGSSNLDVCGGVGTIFSILRHECGAERPESSLLRPGSEQVAAGYVFYGSSTVFILTLGQGVDMFVLDSSIGAFVRVQEGLKIPPAKKSYSVNEGNRLGFPAGYQQYLHWAQQQSYSARYVGTMVADVHRILLKGGVFLYPPTAKAPQGKLRLLYEANPMAMIIEQAGGKALAAPGRRLLDVRPEAIHERVPVVLGSPEEVDRVMQFLE